MNKNFIYRLWLVISIATMLSSVAMGETVGDAVDAIKRAKRGRDQQCVENCREEYTPERTIRVCKGIQNYVGCVIDMYHNLEDCVKECPDEYVPPATSSEDNVSKPETSSDNSVSETVTTVTPAKKHHHKKRHRKHKKRNAGKTQQTR